MWSAITSYLGDSSSQAHGQEPSTPRRAPPPLTSPIRSPRASLSSVMASSADSSGNGPSSAQEVTILRGLVVGSPQSGKTSLLRRLRGEPLNHEETRRLMALLPWRMSDALAGPVAGAAVHGENAREFVQLYLSEAPSFSSLGSDRTDHYQLTIHNQWKTLLRRATRRNTLDFIVWIIDSRIHIEDLLHFVRQGLECLFPPHRAHLVHSEDTVSTKAPQGHNQRHDDQTNDEFHGKQTGEQQNPPPSTADETNHESSPPLLQNLCMLLNFKDLQYDTNQNHDNQSSLLHRVRQEANAVLARHTGPATLTPNTPNHTKHPPSVLVYESSMISNYGIQSLHSFIALPYLLHKENEYARRFMEVQREYDRVKHELVLKTEKDSEGDTYDAFLKKNGGAQNDDKRRKERVRHGQHKPTPTCAANDERSSDPDPRSVVADTKSKKTTQVSRQPSDPECKATHMESNTHRKLFSSSQQTSEVATMGTAAWTPLDNSNGNNLDSFFSDEEESDADVDEFNHDSVGQKHTLGKVTRGASNNRVLDSHNDSGSSHNDTVDDDGENSDDDFFIDSAGNRHTHASPSIKGREIKNRMLDAEKQCDVEVVQSTEADPTDVKLEEKKQDEEASAHHAAEDDGQSMVDDSSVRNENDEESYLEYDTDSRDAPIHEVVKNEDIENESLVDSKEVHYIAREESDLDYDINNGDISEHDDGEIVIGEFIHKDDELTHSKPCVKAPTNARFETEPIAADSVGDVDADDEKEVRPSHGIEEKCSPGSDREFSLSWRSAGQESSVIVNDTTTESSESETKQTIYGMKTTDKASTAVIKKSNSAFKSQMVLDSDDESTGVPKSKADSRVDALDDHEYVDAVDTKLQYPPDENELLPKYTNKRMPEIKATPSLSNAARAAIEMARLEAEQALGECNSKSKEKKSKKESKKKSSKSKKS